MFFTLGFFVLLAFFYLLEYDLTNFNDDLQDSRNRGNDGQVSASYAHCYHVLLCTVVNVVY